MTDNEEDKRKRWEFEKIRVSSVGKNSDVIEKENPVWKIGTEYTYTELSLAHFKSEMPVDYL